MREILLVLVPVLVFLGVRALWQRRGGSGDASWGASRGGGAVLVGDVAVVRAAELRPSSARMALTLANVEGRRLIAHPVFIILGILLPLSQILLFSLDAGGDDNITWMAVLWSAFLGLSAMIASNLGALRSRRERTEELFDSEPMSPSARTVGHLTSAVWAAVAAAVLLSALVALAPAIGKSAVFYPGERFLPSFDLLQLPMSVAVLAVLGVAIARWLPYPPVGPVVAVVWFVGPLQWLAESGARWLMPLVFPDGRSVPSAVMAWHVAYLGGLCVLLGSVAVLRSGWSRPVAFGLGAGAAVTVAAGAIQLAVA